MNFPTYTLLQSRPTRGLPPDLEELEKSPKHLTRQDAFEMELLASSVLPRPDAQVLTIFVRGEDSSVLTLRAPDAPENGCVPLFTERWRAVDYALTLLTGERDLRFAVMSPESFVVALRDFEKTAPSLFTIDRCPRCDTFVTYRSTMADTADYLIRMMMVHKATELARCHLYLNYAMVKARAGQFDAARDVALETVGHVTMSDPDTHLLLGQLGIVMGDRDLVREAHAFLRFFKSNAWDRKLDLDEDTGRPEFAGPE